MTATSTALGSWARLEQPNYKELNLFIGKHGYSTVIGVKGTLQDRKTGGRQGYAPTVKINKELGRSLALKLKFIFLCLSENIKLSSYFLHCPFLTFNTSKKCSTYKTVSCNHPSNLSASREGKHSWRFLFYFLKAENMKLRELLSG